MHRTPILAGMSGLGRRTVLGIAAALAVVAMLASAAGAARTLGPPLVGTVTSPAPGAVLKGKVVWTVQVSGPAATHVDFVVDGKVSSRLKVSSKDTGTRTYRYGGPKGLFDTKKLREGGHKLDATAVGDGSSSTGEVDVTVDNVPDPTAPVDSTPPVVRGDALVGRTLTTTEGQWNGARPMEFTYGWLRCQEDCVAVGDGRSYTVTADDVGSTLRSTVMATNSLGSASASSQPTAVVPAPAPEVHAPHLVSIPVVSGDALVGHTLTSSTGEWTGTTPMSFSVVWLRCHEGCVTVGGGSTYAVGPEDAGSTIRSRVTATNVAGSASESSAPTALVPTAEPTATAPHLVHVPVITGDALVGRTLTSSAGDWSGTTPMAFAFVWRRCHESTCTDVGDGPSYTVTAEDVGYVIRSRVTATNDAGSASESSAPTGVVAQPD